ncbi:MAG: bacteriocin [Oscillospiraceae bacterium]|nr:bacteriocin [Oscillospiraceae bacterium]
MMILIVDDETERLAKTTKLTKILFPDAEILAEHDPLMAGKYALFHPVDVLISALRMHRADGLVMKRMVRYANENAKVYLMGTMEHFDQWNLVDLVGKLDYPGVDGLLVYPITQESLEKVLCAKPDSNIKMVKRTVQEVYEALKHDEFLQCRLAQAAMDDDLEQFFREQGCEEPMCEIQAYFQKKAASSAKELTEDELEAVIGGVTEPQSFPKMILSWMDYDLDTFTPFHQK